MGQYYALVAEIKRVDPNFVDKELLPPGGIAGLSWEGRKNLIDSLRMQLAVDYYRIRGEAAYFQVETVRFLQNIVDAAYKKGVILYNAGAITQHLSREEAIGNYIDPLVRRGLKNMFASYGISYGPRSDVTINNRDRIPPQGYRIPDARIGDITYDWTLTLKTFNGTPQIRDYFRTESRVRAVIIIRPSQLGRNSTYLIPRATGMPL